MARENSTVNEKFAGKIANAELAALKLFFRSVSDKGTTFLGV